MHFARILLLVAALAFASAASSQAVQDPHAPRRTVDVYVLPYYQSADRPGGRPTVMVAKAFDAQLSSDAQADIVAVRDAIQADPRFITPMTLMVLAIRLYDVGLRDDAVFWFYVAKDRYLAMAGVLDVKNPAMGAAADAIRNFAVLAGPFFNTYAFCDIARQRDTVDSAIAWVEANPYETMFVDSLPALPGDRRQNLDKALAELKSRAAVDRHHFDDPATVDSFRRNREANHADEQFCWKS